MRIYNPVAAANGERVHELATLPSRRPLRVGTLENTKPNAGTLLRRVAEGLASPIGTVTVAHERKASVAAPADGAIMARLRGLVDIGITGTGD